MPVTPATWEAEAGESLEPRRQELQLTSLRAATETRISMQEATEECSASAPTGLGQEARQRILSNTEMFSKKPYESPQETLNLRWSFRIKMVIEIDLISLFTDNRSYPTVQEINMRVGISTKYVLQTLGNKSISSSMDPVNHDE
ncbi:hypothetical protein AAY473_002015, partial [Plecturocebus cupreus]